MNTEAASRPTSARRDAAFLVPRAHHPGAPPCRGHVRFHPGPPLPRVLHLRGLRGARPLQGPGDRRERPRLHAGPAPRLRRRPHLGHRQHHPQVDERAARARASRDRWLTGTSSPWATPASWWPSASASSWPKRPSSPPSQQQLGPRAVRRVVRHHRLGQLPVPHRPAQPGRPGRDRQGLPLHAPGRVRRGRTGAPAREPWFLLPFLGPVDEGINKEWHMYPVGVVFGMGFDTATEVALLATTALYASAPCPLVRHHLPARSCSPPAWP